MAEYRLFDPEDPPAWLDPAWWADTENCDHLAHPAGVHTARLLVAARAAGSVAADARADALVDLGCGDGALLSTVDAQLDCWTGRSIGFDAIRDSVHEAVHERGVDAHELNMTVEDWYMAACRLIGAPAYTRPKFVVVLTEVLEHMADPHLFLRSLSRQAVAVVASSPWQETDQAHEWNHAWAWDRAGYLELFENNGWRVDGSQLIEWSHVIVATSTEWGT